MEVIKVAKEYLPFEEKAVGIGKAMQMAFKEGSGIDWFVRLLLRRILSLDPTACRFLCSQHHLTVYRATNRSDQTSNPWHTPQLSGSKPRTAYQNPSSETRNKRMTW